MSTADRTGTEVAMYEQRERHLVAPIGLLVATGDLIPTKDGKSTRPTQLGHFRFKPGQLDQYADAAAKAVEIYGPEPTSLDDVYLLSNLVPEIIDIRIKAWGKSGLRVIGLQNFAELPPDEYAKRVDAWTGEQVMLRPRELSEVPPKLRDGWNGENIPLRPLQGPEDPLIKRFEMRVETTLRFCLPQVLGMGPVVLYATTSKHNRDQLYKALTDAEAWLQGNLIGIPFRFRIRPRKTSYFDKEKRAYLPTQTYEVVFDTPWTYQEAIEATRENRAALIGGTPRALPAAPDSELFADTDARRRQAAEEQLMQIAQMPVPGEEQLTRDEPEAVDRITDAQLNRISALLEQLGHETPELLFGAYGVRSVEQLTEGQAVMYEQSVRRLIGEGGDEEVVEISDDDYEPPLDMNTGKEIEF